MSKPSNNISPAQLWAEITACPRPHRVVDFPRKRPDTGKPYCQVALLVLTPAEQVQAAAAAEKYTRSQLNSPKSGEMSRGFDQVYDNAAGIETLYQCLRVAGDISVHLAPSSDALRDSLTTDEVAVLIEAYAQMCSEIGPIVSMLSPSEMDGWLDRLEVGANSVSPLYLLSQEGKNQVILYLARQLRSLRTASSSRATS